HAATRQAFLETVTVYETWVVLAVLFLPGKAELLEERVHHPGKARKAAPVAAAGRDLAAARQGRQLQRQQLFEQCVRELGRSRVQQILDAWRSVGAQAFFEAEAVTVDQQQAVNVQRKRTRDPGSHQAVPCAAMASSSNPRARASRRFTVRTLQSSRRAISVFV